MMSGSTDPAEPPAGVPSDLADDLADLSDGQLRLVAEYIQDLLDSDQPVSARIEAQADEELVRVTEHDTYTAVVKRQNCDRNCDDCPHGPYLYHVTETRGPDGETELQWSYIGRVES